MIELGNFVVGVEINNKVVDVEGMYVIGLGVVLLYIGDVFCDVVDCDGVFNREMVRLGF